VSAPGILHPLWDGRIIILEDWQDIALCSDPEYDPEWWFSEESEDKKTAIAICHRCEVKKQCLEYSVINKVPFGIWGGKNAPTRKRIRRGESGALLAKPIIIDGRYENTTSKGSKVWFFDENDRKMGSFLQK